jgi:DNA-binding CsgD family transcriptional regulator
MYSTGSSARKGATSTEALILVGRDGTIRGGTPLACHWLHEHLRVKSNATRLPPALRRWLIDPARKRGRCKPFEKSNERARLVISMLREEADNSFALLFQRFERAAPGTRLRHLGITKREDEVLEMLAAGKRNSEIAIALGRSKSTIKRHVENILAKLGVDTRAAAVAIWQESHGNSHDTN